MKRTAIAIAVGALSAGLTHGVLAQDQDEDTQLSQQQQTTEENAQDRDALDTDTQGTNDETDIRVEQEPAEIEVEQEPPEVTVEQQAPEVTIEQPDPNVEIDQAEPEVTIEQQGEAEVRVEGADEASAEIRDDEQRDEDRDQRDDEEMYDDQNGQDRDAQGQGIQVSELENRDLINQDGEELGDIERVVRNIQSGEIYVIVTEGGFLGFGEDEMAYPIENLEIRSEGEVVLQSQSGERSADEFDDDNFEELDGDEEININHMN
ncbi:DUF6470 family protein [Halomonas chromatireducens]|uniref:PRC-barrel domain protein n=1 Tax=Halomonas chromatireducens TaxID=507626 RepID=A0A109UNG4_9GAMM|nr:DUF6470 family protein [Halomonas chromatireducens]AMD02632.1 PRC-barrel domain protein [Halomonas chromatireducens]